MSDAGPSVERRNDVGARPSAAQWAGAFRVAGSSRGSPVGPATRFAPLLHAARNPSGATIQIDLNLFWVCRRYGALTKELVQIVRRR